MSLFLSLLLSTVAGFVVYRLDWCRIVFLFFSGEVDGFVPISNIYINVYEIVLDDALSSFFLVARRNKCSESI